jgi:hypothetical protein
MKVRAGVFRTTPRARPTATIEITPSTAEPALEGARNGQAITASSCASSSSAEGLCRPSGSRIPNRGDFVTRRSVRAVRCGDDHVTSGA